MSGAVLELVGLYRGTVSVCDCEAKTETCFSGGFINHDWCDALFDDSVSETAVAPWVSVPNVKQSPGWWVEWD